MFNRSTPSSTVCFVVRLAGLVFMLTASALAGSATLSQADEQMEKGEFLQAAKIYQGLADKGDAIAQYEVAELYRRGVGFAQDLAKAENYLSKSARQGHKDAQFSLARLFRAQGKTKESVELLIAAAKQGHVRAKDQLKIMHPSVEDRNLQGQISRLLKSKTVPQRERGKILAKGVPRERVLYSLVLANDLAGIKSFIKKSKDQKAALSNTLFYAAETGQRPALSYAISRKVEINQQDNEGRTALMVAAAYGRTKAVESLLNNKAEVNRKDKQGRSAVSWAFGTKRTLPILKLLHSHGADLEVLDKSGERPIFYAVRDGDRKALAFLLSAKVDFHRPNAEGDLAINLALRQKQIVILKDLLNAYAQAGKLKEQSSELAYLAVFTNNKAVTRTLLAAGIDFTQGAQGELSPVELAQQTKAASFLAQLKTAGVDVSAGRVAQTEQKKTQVSAEQKEIVKRLSSDKDLSLSPMLKAAWEGDEKQLRKRHQAGESISLPDKNGLTPLMMAVSRGHVQTVKLLLELGAEVNNYTYKNNSLLGMAVAGDKVEIVQLLMAKKARPTPSENLLAVAAYNNSLEMIESLIATLPAKLVRDEDLEFIFKSALTQGERLPELLVEYVLRSDQVRLKKILLLAAQYGELNLFAQIQKKHPKLLEHDFVKRDVLLSAIQFANADAVAYFLKKIDGDEMEDEAKNSLLHIAAARGDAQVLSQVLKIQKDVDRENLEFYTPLMLAAEAGHVEIVRILLERGADTRIKNRQNETAEDLAALYGYPEVLTLLRKAAEK